METTAEDQNILASGRKRSNKKANKIPLECMVCGKTFARGIIDLQRHTTGKKVL
jgi:hypothetical protein